MTRQFSFTLEELQERADQLAAMDRNLLMRDSSLLNSQQMNDFLAMSTTTGTSAECQFIGFQILFGFDSSGRDFVAVKDQRGNGPHLVLLASQ